MKAYLISVKGFSTYSVEAESFSNAKYKICLKYACDLGYWGNFFSFCKSCRRGR